MKHYTRISTSSVKQDYGTPDNIYQPLHDLFDFTLDPCATFENAKCDKFFTEEQDGLIQNWEGEKVFCNPPYNKLANWLRSIATREDYKYCVVLCPARVGQKYFQEAWMSEKCEQVLFLSERVKFIGAKDVAAFPSAIMYFSNTFFKKNMIELPFNGMVIS